MSWKKEITIVCDGTWIDLDFLRNGKSRKEWKSEVDGER